MLLTLTLTFDSADKIQNKIDWNCDFNVQL